MTDPSTLTREERLAAKLRENLRKRKVQARGQAQTSQERAEETDQEGRTLPKADTKS